MHNRGKKLVWGSFVITLVSAFPRRIYRWASGLALFLKLIRVKNKDTHFLVVPDYIGDGLLTLTYLREYKKQRNIDHVTVVCSPRMKQICEMYKDSIGEIVIYPKKKIHNLELFAASYIGKAMYVDSKMNPSRITIAWYFAYISRWCMVDNAYFTMADVYRNLIFKIGNDAPLERPQIPKVDIETLVEKYELIEGRTVILNPYANSVILNVMQLFEKLANALKEKGFQCVTVTANSEQKAVKGTVALECDLATACNLAAYCGYVIGLRSGFLDLMVFVNCKLVTIDSIDYPYVKFWKIEKCWGSVNPNCSSVVHGDDESQTLQAVLELVDGH